MSEDKSGVSLKLDETGLKLREKMTEMQIKYTEARVLGNKSRKDALRIAGSKAKEETLGVIAYEFENKPEVAEYREYLEKQLQTELSISPHEILYKLRKAYEIAEAKGDTKNMIEAGKAIGMLGGLIDPKGKQSTNVQINNNNDVGNPFKSNELDKDIKRLESLLVIDAEEID